MIPPNGKLATHSLFMGEETQGKNNNPNESYPRPLDPSGLGIGGKVPHQSLTPEKKGVSHEG